MIRSAHPTEAKLLSDLAFRSKGYWPHDRSALECYRENLLISEEEISCGCFYVCEVDAKIIGFYGLSSDSIKQRLYFLFVEPEFIGKGYGYQLWDHAVGIARSRGWTSISFFADRFAAEKFYCPVGCAQIGQMDSDLGELLELRYELKPKGVFLNRNRAFNIEILNSILDRRADEIVDGVQSNCFNAVRNAFSQGLELRKDGPEEMLKWLTENCEQVFSSDKWADIFVIWSSMDSGVSPDRIDVHELVLKKPGYPFALVMEHAGVILEEGRAFQKASPKPEDKFEIVIMNEALAPYKNLPWMRVTWHRVLVG